MILTLQNIALISIFLFIIAYSINKSSKKKYNKVKNEINERNSYIDLIQEKLQLNLQDQARITEKNIHLEQQIKQLQENIIQKENDLQALQKKFYEEKNKYDINYTALMEKARLLENKEAQHIKTFEAMQQEAALRFENLANRIFDHKNKDFQDKSEKTLQQIMTPVQNSFAEFKEKITHIFGQHRDEQISLKTQIEHICALNQHMSKQTENLTKALKGDSKIQGNWGEMILERLLEETGLIKGRDYTLQGEGMKLVNDINHKQQRPDVIVHLPEEKHIIIDSKVSLTHYERYLSQEDAAEKAIIRTQFLKSLKNHIKDLYSKSYQDNNKLTTPDFVFMFIPLEGAYAFAINEDISLHEYAWSHRIILVGTTTLFAAMKTVASIWHIEHQNKNTQKIVDQAGKMYDKFHGFLVDLEKIGDHIQKTQRIYDDSVKKLATGQGNLIMQAEKIKQLGVQTKKNIPKDVAIAASLESA